MKKKIKGWAIWHTCEHCNNFAFASPDKTKVIWTLEVLKKQLTEEEFSKLSIIEVEVQPLES